MYKAKYKKTELLKLIREDFRNWENNCDDIDPGFFNDSDIDSYYKFLLSKYKDELIVIDDTKKGGYNEGTF